MKHTILISALALSLCACAGLTPPNASELARTPHIEFGQPLPAGDNYVLHFPAGKPLPVSTLIDGNLFERTEASELHVVLKRDIYVFRRFASFDGKNWQPGHKLVKTKLELQIPQKDGSRAGLLHLTLDQPQEH
jgi:hypothetical protein